MAQKHVLYANASLASAALVILYSFLVFRKVQQCCVSYQHQRAVITASVKLLRMTALQPNNLQSKELPFILPIYFHPPTSHTFTFVVV
jgi:hypothetical protein